MDISEFLNLDEPEIWLEEKEFTITFTKGVIEIECQFDTRCCGGTERIFINTDELLEVINKLKNL